METIVYPPCFSRILVKLVPVPKAILPKAINTLALVRQGFGGSSQRVRDYNPLAKASKLVTGPGPAFGGQYLYYIQISTRSIAVGADLISGLNESRQRFRFVDRIVETTARLKSLVGLVDRAPGLSARRNQAVYFCRCGRASQLAAAFRTPSERQHLVQWRHGQPHARWTMRKTSAAVAYGIGPGSLSSSIVFHRTRLRTVWFTWPVWIRAIMRSLRAEGFTVTKSDNDHTAQTYVMMGGLGWTFK